MGLLIHAAKLPSSEVDSVYPTPRSGVARLSAPLLAPNVILSILIFANLIDHFLKSPISSISGEPFLILVSPF